MLACMFRIIAAVAAALCLASLAAPAAAEQRRYSVTDFERVVVEGPYRVRLVTGRPSSAVANGTREGLDRVLVDVQGQTLRIRPNRNAWGGNAGADVGPVTVELATRIVRSVRVVGPGRVEVAGAAGLNVEFSVEGSGTLSATRVAADTLALGLLGSGRLELEGTARRLRATVQGTGDLVAPGLRTREAAIGSTSAGSVAVTVDGPVTVTSGGLGEIAIHGRPVCTVRGSAPGQVRCPAPRSDQSQPR